MKRPLQPGTLVAIMGGVANDQIRRICRVVSDEVGLVFVENDSVIEGDAAVEYDFPTPEPGTFEVPVERLRLIEE